jgi:PAS domain S-box-containing protein
MKISQDKTNKSQDQQWIRDNLQLVHAEPSIKSTPSFSFDVLMTELQGYKQELVNQIEELRKVQARTEISRSHYLQLYDFAPVGYASLNEEGMIVEINLTGAKLLKLERKYIINQHFTKFVTDGFQNEWERQCLIAKEIPLKHCFELPIRQVDGNILYAHFDCIYNESIVTPSTFHVVFTDITERKKAEEALRIAAVTFEMQDGIIVADSNKVIQRVNKAFSRITGYHSREVVGFKPSFLRSGLHDRAFYRDLWATVARNGFWEGEIWNKRKDGELFPAWQTITAVMGEDKTISHYVGAFNDITVQKQAEKVLLDARDQLAIQVVNTQEELEQIKQETAEINTALNVILRHRELDKTEAQNAFSHEVEATVIPLLKKLKGVSNGRIQSNRLIGILESSLQHLVDTYGRGTKQISIYQKLTPIETRVASMIRQGLPTKTIAATMNISAGTVEIHRKHIRKKLGLDGKANNLHSYLVSLSD